MGTLDPALPSQTGSLSKEENHRKVEQNMCLQETNRSVKAIAHPWELFFLFHWWEMELRVIPDLHMLLKLRVCSTPLAEIGLNGEWKAKGFLSLLPPLIIPPMGKKWHKIDFVKILDLEKILQNTTYSSTDQTALMCGNFSNAQRGTESPTLPVLSLRRQGTSLFLQSLFLQHSRNEDCIFTSLQGSSDLNKL